MSRPIAPEIVAEARRLLAEGRSTREVARVLPISQGKVGELRSALLGHKQRRQAKPDRGPASQRCPSCGGLVQLPCVACATRRHVAVVGREPLPAAMPDAPHDFLQHVRAAVLRLKARHLEAMDHA